MSSIFAIALVGAAAYYFWSSSGKGPAPSNVSNVVNEYNPNFGPGGHYQPTHVQNLFTPTDLTGSRVLPAARDPATSLPSDTPPPFQAENKPKISEDIGGMDPTQQNNNVRWVADQDHVTFTQPFVDAFDIHNKFHNPPEGDPFTAQTLESLGYPYSTFGNS